MENFLKLATNRNSLKSLTKDFYIDELERFSLNLNIIIKQHKEQELKLKEKNKEKNKKIENIKLLLAEQGLSINDLMANSLHQGKKTSRQKPNYHRNTDWLISMAQPTNGQAEA